MKKTLTTVSSIFALSLTLAACGGADAEDTVTVGVNGSGIPLWEDIADQAAEEGINIEVQEFSDYVLPNEALNNKEIDFNAFQTISYFDNFIEDHGMDLEPIAGTYIAPMGLYSEEYESHEEIPEGATIAVPEEDTNQGRALLLLEEAGFIELPEDFDGVGDARDIQANPHDIEIEEVDAAQTPRVLPDVDGSVINNGVAVEAGFIPVDDAIFIEDADGAAPYINILAVHEDDKDDETLQRIAEIYHTEETEDVMIELYENSLIPTFVEDVDELRDY
ncbi:MetQ/NlpA family ABC transporter substrate-binding protein [Texcoconibacillus texcoconensis]|uniref:Lipoprotein n=1 Tax=Texcoconibacillus texcoconensis TaxID=1095777 RepID=A0A840QQ01_9BACI|nr:MetQ/NlpA family ABC transporter substrate-binding protein [Texcoconibacillus texcoconensis]MBB5173502.1 D-methionine transport system substrate-binding protein [Texcoconibacillus texcoconensis]